MQYRPAGCGARAVTGAEPPTCCTWPGAPSGPPRTSTAGAPQCQKGRSNAQDFGEKAGGLFTGALV